MKPTTLALLLLVAAAAHAQKPAPLSGPKRTISVVAVDVKPTVGQAPVGVGLGVSGNFGTARGAGNDYSIEVSDKDFGEGLADMLITALADSGGFAVIEYDPRAPKDPDEAPKVRPQYLLRGTVTQISCRARSGGLSISIFDGGQGQFENRVVLDVRLIDASNNVVVESIQATGRKTSKNSVFGAQKWAGGSLFNPDTKVLDLTFGDFESSALGDAARLALQDAAAKLLARAGKRPWEANAASITKDGIYLDVTGESGLKAGDVLEAFIPGDPILDPKSGRPIGRTKGEVLGKVVVVEATPEYVLCRTEGFEPKAGMAVRYVSRG